VKFKGKNMVSLEVFERKYDEPISLMHPIENYLVRIASAMVNLFKRIFCCEDELIPEDHKWKAWECQRLERENCQLKRSIEDLQLRVERLKRTDSLTVIEKLCIEGMLFLVLCPYYLLGLPVISY
jgi:hypothetical protein